MTTQVSGINLGDVPQVGSVGFPGPAGLAGRDGFAITGPWDMTPAAPAPASCAQPLGATEAEVQGLGFDGRLTLADADQTGLLTAVGGVDRQLAAFPTNPLTSPATFSLVAGKRVIEWLFTAPLLAEAGQVDLSVLVTNVAGGTPLSINVRRYPGQPDAECDLQVTVNGSTRFSGAVALTGDSLVVGAEFDAAAGTLQVKAGGTFLTLSSSAYTGTAQTVHAMSICEYGLTGVDVGTVYSVTARTAASDISQAYGTGATDLCGNALGAGAASLPDGALPGDVYEVTVAGTYGGVSFGIGDLAVVRSNGTSVTRIPAAGMTAAEVAAAIATAVAEHAAGDDPHGDRAYAAGLDAGLQAQIDLKLDAAAYVQHFLGKFVDEPALIAAHPVGTDGDYAIIDAGGGTAARQYVWDAEAGWVDSGAVKSGTTTDQLAEGSTNLWFTYARVRSTLLTGLSLLTGGAIAATDTLLQALGKLQVQVTGAQATADAHAGNTNNPHGTTAAQVGAAPKFGGTGTLSSASGVVAIDASAAGDHYTLTLTENVTSWSFTNLPAAGTYRDIFVHLVQDATTARTVVSPATAGRTAGGAWVASSTLSSRETLGLRIFSTGTVHLFPSGVMG